MKLSSSTGDFSNYVDRIDKKVECFKETKFKYINLEQTGNTLDLYYKAEDDWNLFAESCAKAAEFADIK